MSAPSRIYLQVLDEDGEPAKMWATWCEDRIHDTDAEYVLAPLMQAEKRVARAAQVYARIQLELIGYGAEVTFAEYLAGFKSCKSDGGVAWRAVLEALEALEELEAPDTISSEGMSYADACDNLRAELLAGVVALENLPSE